MQYAASIDDFARIMKDGNNGGYANDWLVADRKTNEVASLELGLKNVTLQRTRDGFFVGSNFPVEEKLTREETDFDVNNAGESANARHARWLQLMHKTKAKSIAAPPSASWPTTSTPSKTRSIPTNTPSAAISTVRRVDRCPGSAPIRPPAPCNRKSPMAPWPKL